MINQKAPLVVRKKYEVLKKFYHLNQIKLTNAQVQGDYSTISKKEYELDLLGAKIQLLEELFNENLVIKGQSTQGQSIGNKLARNLRSRGHLYTLENFYLRSGFECDVLTITRSKKVYEYEIKTSLEDYKADFKKESKHQELSNGKYPINYFYYVAPKGLIDVGIIPRYAGLMTPNFEVLKKAPQINKLNHFDALEKIILNRVYYYWRDSQAQIDRLKMELSKREVVGV